MNIQQDIVFHSHRRGKRFHVGCANDSLSDEDPGDHRHNPPLGEVIDEQVQVSFPDNASRDAFFRGENNLISL